MTTLLRSSQKSWLSASPDIRPSLDEDGNLSFDTGAAKSPSDIGIAVQGRFESWFAGSPYPLPIPEGSTDTGINTVLAHSLKSARIILYASNDFLDDQILNAVVTAAGTQYVGPLELFMNTLDWAVQDGELLKIRSGGHFNRTLPALERDAQQMIEYVNYAATLVFFLLLATLHQIRRILRKRHYARAFREGGPA